MPLFSSTLQRGTAIVLANLFRRIRTVQQILKLAQRSSSHGTARAA
jgi:hypothetical protein